MGLRAGVLPVTQHMLIVIEFVVRQMIFQLLPVSAWLNSAAAVRVRSVMSLGPREVSQIASFP